MLSKPLLATTKNEQPGAIWKNVEYSLHQLQSPHGSNLIGKPHAIQASELKE